MASNLQVLFRNSRIRSSLIILIVCVFLFTLYFLHSKHSQFQNLNEMHSKCLQTKDTLSAQLQVAHEHRSRVEKFLEKEKKLVKDTKEGLELQNMELERSCKRDKTDLQFKLDQVLKSHEETQTQLSAAQEELKQFELKYQEEISKLAKEKETEVSRIQNQLDELINLREHQDKELSQVNFKNKKLEDELGQCQFLFKQQVSDHQQDQETSTEPLISQPSDIFNFKSNASGSKSPFLVAFHHLKDTLVQNYLVTTENQTLGRKIAKPDGMGTRLSDKIEIKWPPSDTTQGENAFDTNNSTLFITKDELDNDALSNSSPSPNGQLIASNAEQVREDVLSPSKSFETEQILPKIFPNENVGEHSNPEPFRTLEQKKTAEQSVPEDNAEAKEATQAPALNKPALRVAEKPSFKSLNEAQNNLLNKPLPLPLQLNEKNAPAVDNHPNIPPPRDPETNLGNNLLGDGSKNNQIHPPVKMDMQVDAKDDEKGYPHAPEDDMEEDPEDEGHLALPNGKLHPFHDFDDQSQDNYNKNERRQPARPDSVLAAP